MSKYSEKSFFKSFGYAIKGFKVAIKSQKNFVRQIIVACLAVIAGILLNFNILEYCILTILIAMVLMAEMFNSVIEFTIDSVVKNNFSKLAGMAKDMSAAGVCIASFTAVIVGGIMFVHKILPLLLRGL